jgi:PAS domain S-box-containing protein
MRSRLQQLALALMDSTIGLALIRDGRFLDANDAFCSLTGYSREELTQRRLPDRNHSDDDALPFREIEALLTGKRRSVLIEKRYRRKDGVERWVRVTLSLLPDESPPLILGIAVDLTEQRRCEQALAERTAELQELKRRLRIVEDGAGVGLYDWRVGDASGAYLSPGYLALLGLPEDAAPISAEQWFEWLHPDDRAAARSKVFATLDGEGEHYENRFRLRHADGSYKHILSRGIVQRDEQGRAVRLTGVHIDFTERIRVESKLRDFLDSISEGFFSVDPSFRLLQVNAAMCRATQKSEKELVGKILWDCFPEAGDPSSPYWLHYQRVMETREPATFVAHDAPLDRWTEVRAYPVPDSGLAVFLRDVTESRQTRARLAESERRTAILADNAASGLFLLDERGYPTFMNASAKRLTGYDDLAELADRPVAQTLAGAGPVDDGTLPRAHSLVEALARHEAVREREDVFRRKDGTTFPVRYSLSPIEADGTVTGAVLEFRDVTEEKRLAKALADRERELLEHRNFLRNLIDSIPHMVWVADESGTILETNRGYEEYTGFPDEQLRRDGWKPIIHPDDLDRAMESWSRAVRTKTTYDTEMRLRRHDGAFRWHLVRARPYQAPSGAVHWFGTNTDVDDERRQTEALRVSNAELARFAFVASHDLKEPLRTISSFAQLVRRRADDNLDDTARQYLGHITQAAKRMYGLIEDLLSYSRVGSTDLDKEPVALDRLLGEVLENLHAAIEQSEADIRLPEPFPVVWGDRSQLLQLFQNLLSNALKYRGSAAPVVTVHVDERDHDWLFAVRDNGVGIAQEHWEKVFVLFQRATQTSAASGAGIGLALCKRIVERHGGKIWLESQLGKGTTFYFTLPKPPHAQVSAVLPRQRATEHA